MKTLIALATVSMMAVSGASALSFGQVDNHNIGNQDSIAAVGAGDGQISYKELRNAIPGVSAADFDAADANGNGKLSPTEFRTIG
ncbi:MAG: hypothetical protein ABJL73_07475 [Lentilitoribacter sp.]|mmetsp:Transcript_11043/g.14501  ORF Transcript_11043/g.14501 Transcript_11043/m.14501 type:complete len:85 (-) Transcript_11043:512-766(-)|eukprot:CAMPEP_0195266926 /NCGR_PEP_ID=MMETSP0706-20130129/12295_1 /TAXON_ID=33640 /ORGANISM="Asterionellopsis glacialis, Strain CCMP134" /LENGTH=84 /DNA_ID=CAMNT_0040321599 /DNA_START=122 /DNA_END=376 /DNA_ORIENTATION=-